MLYVSCVTHSTVSISSIFIKLRSFLQWLRVVDLRQDINFTLFCILFYFLVLILSGWSHGIWMRFKAKLSEIRNNKKPTKLEYCTVGCMRELLRILTQHCRESEREKLVVPLQLWKEQLVLRLARHPFWKIAKDSKTSYISLLYGYSMILLYNHSLILLYKIEQTKLSLLYW